MEKDYQYYKEQVDSGEFFEDPSILALSDETGWSIAHVQAGKGWRTEDTSILALSDKHGWSVAHRQAMNNWNTEDPLILAIADNDGYTVEELQRSNGWEPKRNQTQAMTTRKKVEEFDAREIWADYENRRCKLHQKEFVESKHYFALRKAVKDFIEDNLHLADGDNCTLKPLKDAINYH